LPRRLVRPHGTLAGDPNPTTTCGLNGLSGATADDYTRALGKARKNLFPLIEQVNDGRTPIEITSRRGDAVLMARADYDALEETVRRLRAPTNARRLLDSLQQAMAGQRATNDLDR
jgi:antitoxin YefM